MSEIGRTLLSGKFQNGDRPNETDFSDLIDSCLNKVSDGLTVDTDLNLILTRGLRLGNSAATVAGGLRFAAGQVEFHDGTNWLPMGGNSGAFSNLTANTVAYNGGGSVGIGAFASPGALPTYRFEVNLPANGGTPAEQVRFGNAVVCNGSGAFQGFAYFAHRDNTSSTNGNTNYALRQSSAGATHVNSAASQVLSFRQGGAVRMGISASGQVIVAGEGNLSGSANQALQVNGSAFKNDGNANWAFTSDARVKEDVRDLEVGLTQLRRVRPVRYRYNGRAGTRAGLPGVGILGQEIEQIFPETIEKVPAAANSANEIDDLRIFNPSALTFVLINAVKELADKVEKLEQALASSDARTVA